MHKDVVASENVHDGFEVCVALHDGNNDFAALGAELLVNIDRRWKVCQISTSKRIGQLSVTFGGNTLHARCKEHSLACELLLGVLDGTTACRGMAFASYCAWRSDHLHSELCCSPSTDIVLA